MAQVTGQGGTQEVNTVVATGVTEDGDTVEGVDQASVAILDSQARLAMVKLASPKLLPEPGGPVTFSLRITNRSLADAVTVETLTDSVYGDLDGVGTCTLPQLLAAGESYRCSFSVEMTGARGETHLDVVRATGTSDDGKVVASQAVAIVAFGSSVARGVSSLGSIGLALLALILATWGAVVIRPRRL
jgi:hypothetical protein